MPSLLAWLGCSDTVVPYSDLEVHLRCGEGTVEDDGECVAEGGGGDRLGCGEGTHREGDECVADGDVIGCGRGTVLAAGTCIAVSMDEVTCGEGTKLSAAECVPTNSLSCGFGTQRAGDECVAVAGVTCGTGTELVGVECVPQSVVSCGTGTTLMSGECVPVDTEPVYVDGGVVCGEGTVLDAGTCEATTLACGEGTVEVDGECVPVDATCGLGTHVEGTMCVVGATPLPTTETFTFSIAEKADTGVVYFLDMAGTAVHRYDLVAGAFLTPHTLDGYTASTMAVAPAGDILYLGRTGGRIETIGADDGDPGFLVAAPETVIWMMVVGDYLFVIDGSGAWETHSTYDRSTGERVFADDWRNTSRGAAFAPGLQRIFTFRDSSSPNDIYYTAIDPATGLLGLDTESPYHGDYSLGHPLRVSLDEQRVFVASGVAFRTSDLTYDGSIGLSYVDLAFHGERMYLLRPGTAGSQLVITNLGYAVQQSVDISGTPLRLFEHEDTLTVFTRNAGQIATWTMDL